MRSLRGGAFAPKPREKSHSKSWPFPKITKKMVLVLIGILIIMIHLEKVQLELLQYLI